MRATLSSPNTAAGRLQRAALEALQEHEANGEIPTNGRFLFYELEGRGIVFKTEPGKRRGTTARPGPLELSEATMVLRELGHVPWNWIVDETRSLHEWEYADSIAEYVRNQLDYARLNPWSGEPPLLLVESRSLGGVLRPTVMRFLVPIAATNGQVGGFLHTDIVPLLERDPDRAVLYLGDLDHQGEQIEQNTRDVLEREVGEYIDWTRIALTQDQVDERGLDPIVKIDKRYNPPLRSRAWECEALGQSTIVELVVEALDSLLPESLDDVQVRQEQQKDAVREFLEGLEG